MTRVNFSLSTKELIAKRAGYQCSFPTCTRQTISGGPTANSLSGSGVAAHIFSASIGGPRGHGGLAEDELALPENGIWLCSDHARLVDNNSGVSFPAETLLSYKMLQEARIIREHQGLYSPIGWIHEVEISENPLFERGQKVFFAKLNLFYGSNMTGKTALTEWIGGTFKPQLFGRWQPPKPSPLRFKVSFLNPEVVAIDVQIGANGARSFRINGQPIPFNPVGFRVFRLTRLYFDHNTDHLSLLSEMLGLPADIIFNLISEVNMFPYAKVRNIRFELENNRMVLYADSHGSIPGLSLNSMSGGAIECVFIEFVTAAARISGRYVPSLLILDGCPSVLSDGIFEFYSHHLLDPANQFQTIMCVPDRNFNLDNIRWNGWEVVRMVGKEPSVRITQELRMSKPA